MYTIFYIILYFLVSVKINEAARILVVIPFPSISHQVVFRPLIQELAKRGHEVVVVTTDPAFPKGQTPANLTEIDIHNVSYALWKETLLTIDIGKQEDLISQMTMVLDFIPKLVAKQVLNKEFKKLIDTKHDYFDLLMLESCVRPALGLSHVFKVPVILASSFGRYFRNYDTIGAPGHPLLYPLFTRQRINNLTFWEKISELYNEYRLLKLFDNHEENDNAMIRRTFGTDAPGLQELNKNIALLMLNIHPIWEGNVPVPPNVVYMWGMHQKPKKDLPQELKSYLDSSKHGVIYMSFGTNSMTQMLPPEKVQIIIKVFSQLPYDVLWKWDKDELPGRTKNIRISKWFPQSDLLRHPKIKIFITQGGLQSIDEAMTAGVPVIGIPMLGDQWFNVEKFVYHKIGVRLDMGTLTEDRFSNAIKTVIGDESYRRNMVKLGILMHDQPQPPLERAVWWTEHVLQHGSAHLRAPAANMSWWQFVELELVFTLLVGFLAIVISFVSVLYCLFSFIVNKYVKSDKIKTS